MRIRKTHVFPQTVYTIPVPMTDKDIFLNNWLFSVNGGDYIKAVLDRNLAENISRVLYPNDNVRNVFFYNNCQNSRVLIGWQLFFMRVQTIKITSDVMRMLSQQKIHVKPIPLDFFFHVVVKKKKKANRWQFSMVYTLINHKMMS